VNRRDFRNLMNLRNLKNLWSLKKFWSFYNLEGRCKFLKRRDVLRNRLLGAPRGGLEHLVNVNFGNLRNVSNLGNLKNLNGFRSRHNLSNPGFRFDMKRLVRPAPAALVRPLDEGRRGGEDGSGCGHIGTAAGKCKREACTRQPKRLGDAAAR
jgi:hypothetical protein